ncbi:MAG: hypothetical protein LH702_23210 [Phormidesmis sp. CAN_BIN44]|nr:hypothetical protein [Phormidesmis sp. CAN_BIN44]
MQDWDAPHYLCLKSDANTSPVKSALKWSIKGEENRQAKFGGSYVLVSADVNGEANRFRVWKSDDRFANETAVYGKGFEYLNKLSDRALWSSEKNCVEVE